MSDQLEHLPRIPEADIITGRFRRDVADPNDTNPGDQIVIGVASDGTEHLYRMTAYGEVLRVP